MHTWIPTAREFAYLTWKQVEALAKQDTLLVLPLATDTLINNLLLGKALEKLPREAPVYALPPLCYGKSNEHLGFPGTLSISSSTFLAVGRDLGASIAASGFKKLVIFNTHGGNSSLVDVLARDLRAEFGLRTFCLFGSGGASYTGLSAQEKTYGFHAGEVETAFLLSALPGLVHTSAYTHHYIAHLDAPDLLLPENAAATFAWLTRDIAPSGVMGDPRPATAEHGAQWIEEAAAKIAAALSAMLQYRSQFDV
jgi:creatinine amidohydrolase